MQTSQLGGNLGEIDSLIQLTPPFLQLKKFQCIDYIEEF